MKTINQNFKFSLLVAAMILQIGSAKADEFVPTSSAEGSEKIDTVLRVRKASLGFGQTEDGLAGRTTAIITIDKKNALRTDLTVGELGLRLEFQGKFIPVKIKHWNTTCGTSLEDAQPCLQLDFYPLGVDAQLSVNDSKHDVPSHFILDPEVLLTLEKIIGPVVLSSYAGAAIMGGAQADRDGLNGVLGVRTRGGLKVKLNFTRYPEFGMYVSAEGLIGVNFLDTALEHREWKIGVGFEGEFNRDIGWMCGFTLKESVMNARDEKDSGKFAGKDDFVGLDCGVKF